MFPHTVRLCAEDQQSGVGTCLVRCSAVLFSCCAMDVWHPCTPGRHCLRLLLVHDAVPCPISCPCADLNCAAATSGLLLDGRFHVTPPANLITTRLRSARMVVHRLTVAFLVPIGGYTTTTRRHRKPCSQPRGPAPN